MTNLVPLKDLLLKYGISRKTYHNMLNKGLLPHYAKRHGEPGKPGARYLYDAEAFDAAWRRHVERTGKGLGIDVQRRDEAITRLGRMSKGEKITFLLEDFEAGPEESLTEYEGRIEARRQELGALPDEQIELMTLERFRGGATPRSWK